MSKVERLQKEIASLKEQLQQKANDLTAMQETIERLDAEKMSCDQGWATAMRELHQVRTDLILYSKKLVKAEGLEKALQQQYLEEEAKRKEAESLLRKFERKADKEEVEVYSEEAEEEEEEFEKVG